MSDQTNVTSVPIDRFWGIDLPCYRGDLEDAFEEKGHDGSHVSYDERRDEYRVRKPVLNGVDFGIAYFRMYNRAIVYRGEFSKSFGMESRDDAFSFYDDIMEMIKAKYGFPNKIDSESYIKFYAWIDKLANSIFLTIGESVSKVGEKRFYVDLEFKNNKYHLICARI